jgi:hypothetical protein
MMVGEIDAIDTILTPITEQTPYSLHFKEITIVFEALFVIFMPILLINLMVYVKDLLF